MAVWAAPVTEVVVHMTPWSVAVFVAGTLLLPSMAEAYIDLGTGSLLAQALIAAVMGALIALKGYWARIRSFFSRRDPSEPAEQKGE